MILFAVEIPVGWIGSSQANIRGKSKVSDGIPILKMFHNCGGHYVVTGILGGGHTQHPK